MDPTGSGLQRTTPHRDRARAAYLYLTRMDEVQGWLLRTTAAGMLELLWAQEERGAQGSGLAEVGIHHGKSFLVLTAAAMEQERLFAIDVFEQQELNLDLSGKGDRDVFLENLEWFFPGAAPTVIARSSAELWEVLPDLGMQGLRFFSVDGGHTRALTVNDLRLADRTLAEDGVCALDDLLNPHWTGVISGLVDFLRDSRSLVPFALLPNKLMLCRPGQAGLHATALRNALPTALEKTGCELLDWSIDVYGERPDLLPERLRLRMAEFGPMPAGERRFDEASYLSRYPDVAQAVRAGTFASGQEHFDLYGRAEGRWSRGG